MKAAIQNKIAPASTIGKSGSPELSIPSTPAIDSNASKKPEIDFKSLLMNSNEAAREKKMSQSKGDLAGAESYEDFLESLNKSTNNQRVPKNSLEKDDFLKLFVTQLQNQDPLSPKDGTEMASQMAQFNSVEQMINFNKGLERIEKATISSNATNFVNYIGKDISVKGGRINLTKEGIGNVSFNAPKDVVSAKLEIKDAGGTLVKTKELGQVPAGDHKLGWDGLNEKGDVLPLGNYSFSIKGTTINGEEIDTEITTNLKITGVDLASGEAQFFTDMGKLKPDQIAAIGENGFMNKAQELQQDKMKAALAQKAKEVEKAKLAESQNTPQNETITNPSNKPVQLPIKEQKADQLNGATAQAKPEEMKNKNDNITQKQTNETSNIAGLPNQPASKEI